jgi:hypothetical protein
VKADPGRKCAPEGPPGCARQGAPQQSGKSFGGGALCRGTPGAQGPAGMDSIVAV